MQRCLNQHAEIKVVSSSLFSDEETVRVDVHIALQSDISMPLAISSLQKQIKRYLDGEITEIEALEQEPLQGSKQKYLGVDRVMNTLA